MCLQLQQGQRRVVHAARGFSQRWHGVHQRRWPDYSSGSGGSYAGQSSNGSAARWKVENLRLYGDAMDGAGFQDLGLTASRNSSGSIILNAGGREYSMCN